MDRREIIVKGKEEKGGKGEGKNKGKASRKKGD